MEEVKTVPEIAQVGAAVGMSFAAAGVGIGLSIAIKALMEAISRQPEIANKAFVYFIVGAGLTETCAIYALLVAMILILLKGRCSDNAITRE